MTRDDWGIADAEDARVYLGEVGRLWAAWMVGLAGLAFTDDWWLIASGVVVIAALLWLARPLQARAADLVPHDEPTGGKKSLVVARRTERDLALRNLSYGEAPLRKAIEMADAGSWWLGARRGVIALTIIAFVYVLFTWFAGPAAP